MKTKHFCILFVLILSMGQLAFANMPVVMDYAAEKGVHRVRVYLLDPGIVLQEIRVY